MSGKVDGVNDINATRPPFRLTDEQIDVLLRGIVSSRVSSTPDGYSHVEGFDIRAMLIRVFGFGGYDLTHTISLVYENLDAQTSNGKPAVEVCYRARALLVVSDGHGGTATYDGAAVASSKMPDYKRGDAHDFAVKTAETQALKRAATNLGDQFGLSLYNDGSHQPVVRRIVGWQPPASDTTAPDQPVHPDDQETTS